MRYSQQTIDQLVEQLDMLQLARRYVEGLENRGGRWWARCPFHDEKTPSFTIHLERKSYYCFGCQAKGGAVKLVMELDHLSFPEALRKLAEHSGFALPEQGETAAERSAQQAVRKQRQALLQLYQQVQQSFRQNLRSQQRGQLAHQYLQQRGIAAETAERFALGYAVRDSQALYAWLRRQNFSRQLLGASGLFSQRKEEHCLFWQRLIFPVCEPGGSIIAFSGRRLLPGRPPGGGESHSQDGPKYINSRESVAYRKSQSLFGLYQSLQALRKERSLILCEGNLDVLALHQAGLCRAVAPLGTAFTAEQAKLLKRYCDSVLLAFDGDEAGQKASYRAAFLLEQQQISSAVIRLPKGCDPADILLSQGAQGLQSLVAAPLDFFSFLAQDLSQRFALHELGGAAAALRFLAPFISQLQAGLRRELYIAQLAKLFGLKQETLAQEPSWRYQPPPRSSAAGQEGAKQPGAKQPGASRTANRSQTGSQTEPQADGQAQAESPAQSLGAKGSREPKEPKEPREAASRSQIVELEFWACMLLQADLYPEWRQRLGDCYWHSEQALLLKELLDAAAAQQDWNFETLQDRLSRRNPALGDWLLQKKLEPLQSGQGVRTEYANEGYDLEAYRRAILEQKFCGLREFWLRQRRAKLVRQIQALEEAQRKGQKTPADGDSAADLPMELLGESQHLDQQLAQVQREMQQIQLPTELPGQ